MHNGLGTRYAPVRIQTNQLTAVPVVTASKRAHLITLIALNVPIWCVPRSKPAIANPNAIQKLTIATKSILLQLWRR